MNAIVQKITDGIVEKYKQDKNVLGIMLFGSAARGKFDQYSDIDIYIIWGTKGKFSRSNFVADGIRVDIIADTAEEAEYFLKDDKNNVKRNTSHMLAHGVILFQKGKTCEVIKRKAQKNLHSKTKYKNSEMLMHKYSIDDFWGEVQRDIEHNDRIAFGLDSQLLMNNIIELFLKVNGEFFRQPNEIKKLLNGLDKKFANQVERFYKTDDVSDKKRILFNLVKYAYEKSGGPLPEKWIVKD